MTSHRIATFADRATDLALAGIGIATLLALLANQVWFAELFCHFRVQYVAVLLLTGAVAIARRRMLVLTVAGVLLLVNGWYAGPYLAPLLLPTSQAGQAGGHSYSLISLNVWYENRQFDAVRSYLQRQAPDVLVLAELTPEWAAQLRPVTSRYPYWLTMPRESPWGLGVFSKFPLEHAEFEDLGLAGSVNVRAILALPSQPIEFFAVHLSSPTSAARMQARDAQLRALTGVLGKSRGADAPPRLLMGDFNTTPFSPRFTELLQRTGLEDARRRQGWHGTWPTWVSLLQVPIDHCIADPGLGITDVVRGPDVGSDHYPLEIKLQTAG